MSWKKLELGMEDRALQGRRQHMAIQEVILRDSEGRPGVYVLVLHRTKDAEQWPCVSSCVWLKS